VEIYRWRPRGRVLDYACNHVFGVRHVLSQLPATRTNFGDELGPLIVKLMLERLNISPALSSRLSPRPTFFSIGSVLPLVRNGDHVWGTGHLGGSDDLRPNLKNLNVHATRGPLSREILERKGLNLSEPTFGDPGVLTALLLPIEAYRSNPNPKSILIPHIDDSLPSSLPPEFQVVSANSPVRQVICAIAQAEVVVTSSLHAKIIADAFGTPSVIYKGRTTTKFKFDDYALGAGQDELPFEHDAGKALNQAPYVPKSSGRVARDLLTAFPRTIWN